MNLESQLITLYEDLTGKTPSSVEALPSAGSHRRYFRLKGEPTLIGVIGTCVEENEAFVYLDKHFSSKDINVPKVLTVSSDNMAYLQEDLGDGLLFDMLTEARKSQSYSESDKSFLVKTIKSLPKIQFEGAKGLDFSKCYPTANFDARLINWDLNYFKYCFLKATGIEFDEGRLEDDFATLTQELLRDDTDTFMYRDFQSRNVIIKDGEPWFIDFQGGRRGPYLYDLASFLWQAKANYPMALRIELIEEYIEALREYVTVDEEAFYKRLRLFVLFRTLQVLGAYGFRGYFEKKAHFIQSVPYAIGNLRQLLSESTDENLPAWLQGRFEEYPYLDSLLRCLCELPQFNPEPKPQLTVKVMSFGYKHGLPTDASGNGGGYVFDCRGIHNPGKYDCYKQLTGLDEPVKKFLEDDGEVFAFLGHCYALVDASVKRYIERGFTSLMVCFGCTGGRHRSVYCAQHMAEHIHHKFNVRVELVHRERDITQIFNVDA